MELSPEQIIALGKVAFALVIAGLLFYIAITHRVHVGNILKNLTKLTLKGLGGEVSLESSASDEKEDQENNDLDLQEESAELPKEETKASTTSKTPKTKEEWEFEMFDAAIMKEKERAERARDHLISISEDRESKDKYSILFLKWRIRFSKDLSSISLLEEYTNIDKYSKDTVEKAYNSLADVKAFLEDFDKSNEYLRSAISMTDDKKNICRYKCEISSNLHQNDNKEEAFIFLEELLEEFTDKNLQKNIYKEIARLHKLDKNIELSALATEKMIECGDEDSETYFSAGYAYADVDFHKLAFLHYKKALKLGSGAWTLNNMGVQYETLGMPIKSIESYKNSNEKDNTLAAANQAYRLIDAGFIDEAKEILNAAKDKEDVHANVHTALASIKKKEEAEEEKEVKIIEDAKKQRNFLRSFASRYFTKADTVKIGGKYKIYGKYEANVSITKNTVLITWQEPGYSKDYFYDRKIVGDIHNNASKITFFREGSFLQRKTTDDVEFEKDTEGYLYIENSDKIKIAKQNSYHKESYEISEIVKI
jgi:Flp pilus assembly protein TadD